MERRRNATKSAFAAALLAAGFAGAGFAQQPGAAGGAVVASEPGKAAIVPRRS
jgi:hypothetical protein